MHFGHIRKHDADVPAAPSGEVLGNRVRMIIERLGRFQYALLRLLPHRSDPVEYPGDRCFRDPRQYGDFFAGYDVDHPRSLSRYASCAHYLSRGPHCQPQSSAQVPLHRLPCYTINMLDSTLRPSESVLPSPPDKPKKTFRQPLLKQRGTKGFGRYAVPYGAVSKNFKFGFFSIAVRSAYSFSNSAT